MWYIFPQIEGLGHSAMAQKYAISSVAEATEYLNHPELGKRLRECTRLVTAIDGRSIQDIFGYPDYLKFQSSNAFCTCHRRQSGFLGRFEKNTFVPSSIAGRSSVCDEMGQSKVVLRRGVTQGSQ